MEFAIQCVELSLRTMQAIAKLDASCKALEISIPDVRGKLEVIKQDLARAIEDIEHMIDCSF